MANLLFEKLLQNLTANQEWRVNMAGDFFRVSESTYPVVVSLLKNNQIIGTMQNLQAGDYCQSMEFDGVIIKNGGNPQNVTIQVAGGGAGSDRVIGEVSVINGEISRVKNGQCFIGIASQTAGAGQLANCQLWNPLGSGKNIILTKMTFFSGSDAAIGITEYNTALANLSAFVGRNKLLGGIANSAQLRGESNAAGLGGAASIANCNYRTSTPIIEFPFNEPIVIGAGKGVNVYSTALAASLSVTYQWFEESI